jgi:hypothetical protein
MGAQRTSTPRLNNLSARHCALYIFGLIGQDGVVDRVGGALRPVVVLS